MIKPPTYFSLATQYINAFIYPILISNLFNVSQPFISIQMYFVQCTISNTKQKERKTERKIEERK